MNDLTIENFTEENIKKFTIPKLKAFIKEKQLVKLKKCKRKADWIECVLQNKDYVFGGEKPKKVKIVKKIVIKKTDNPKKVKIIKKIKPQKQKKRLFHRVLRTPKTICYDKTKICIGVDEAGAGSMSHHCTVAACILPTECPTPDDEYRMTMWNSIVDSKKYSSNKAKLHELCEYVKEVAIEWSLVRMSEKEIDEINIREARLQGFHRALNAIKTEFNHILIDGDICYDYYKDGKQIPHNCIKQGDAKFRSIAAASLIAKSTRDRFMIEAHKEFPMYNWNKNFGYCGSNHLGLIREHGITKYHRKTFGICKQWRTLPQGNLTDFTVPKTTEEKMAECLFEDDD